MTERKIVIWMAVLGALGCVTGVAGMLMLNQKVEALETELVRVKKVNAWCQDAADTCKKLPAFPRVSYWCEEEKP
jgi:hypothetical protein